MGCVKFYDFIKDQLDNVVLPGDECVLIYSGIWTFAPRLISQFDISPRSFPLTLFKAIEAALGPDRTIIYPSYTFQFPKSRIYDSKNSKADVGVLSKIAIEDISYSRSAQPIYSHCSKGPRSKDIVNSIGKTAWGEGSAMDWFHRNNIRICTLGVPWQTSCSFIHSIEERLEVPYRYYKRFQGEMINENGENKSCEEVMYVRSLEHPIELDYTAASSVIRKGKTWKSSRSDSFPMESILSDELFVLTANLLESDPYIYVKNKDYALKWVTNNKGSEIDSLR